MKKLRNLCCDLNIELDEVALERFEIYMNLVIEWNNKINLTAITDKDEFIIKHIYDSLTLISKLNIEKECSIIDIGTGAGFPGIPLKIARPDINITLLDSLNKRIVFLREQVLKNIGLDATVIHGRAEEYSRINEYREQYDLSVSRAVANLSSLSEYCIPFVKVGGIFVSMKGPDVKEEVEQSLNAFSSLGGSLKKVDTLTLPDNSGRSIVVVKKIRKTPEKYPRRGVKINKSPL